ncbi:MAG: cyanophycinase [Planctomycetaceae bacterium]
MMSRLCRAGCFVLLAVLVSTMAAFGDDNQRINPDGVVGRLLICGGGSIPDSAREAFVTAISELLEQDANKPAGTVVIVGTASDDPGAAAEKSATMWAEAGIAVERIQTAQTDIRDLAEQIDAAVAVWIDGGQQRRLAEAYAGTAVEESLHQLLQRNGVIGGTSAGAAIMSGVMIAGGETQPEISRGLNLLPGIIIDQHFRQRNRQGRSRTAVATNPIHFGLGIDEDTAVLIQGRHLQVVGSGTATVMLAETNYRDADEVELKAGSIADITQLRRAARDRAAGQDPGIPQFGPPSVPHGSLVIVGGGPLPASVVDRFIELAGGTEARIAVLPTACLAGRPCARRLPNF